MCRYSVPSSHPCLTPEAPPTRGSGSELGPYLIPRGPSGGESEEKGNERKHGDHDGESQTHLTKVRMFREPGLLRPSVVPPASITPFHAPLGVLESESLPMELLARLRDDLNDCDTDVYVGRLASDRKSVV